MKYISMHFNVMIFWLLTSVLENVEHGNLLVVSPPSSYLFNLIYPDGASLLN